jgi:phosphohistidine phosphatase
MAVLHVLRHAKSSWDDPGLADVDRPLAPRGRRAARRIGEHLRESGIRPALVLCSPAARARQTVELLALDDAEIVVEDGLYGAGAPELAARLRRLAGAVPHVLLVGHNPALQALVLELARPGELRERVAAKLPTGALATLRLDGAWSELEEGGATLTALALPRELG